MKRTMYMNGESFQTKDDLQIQVVFCLPLLYTLDITFRAKNNHPASKEEYFLHKFRHPLTEYQIRYT